MHFYKSGTIALGSRKITRHRILNTPKNSIFSCYNVDGILGVDIIKQFYWTIDYKNKILIMYSANHFPEKIKSMHKLDFDFQNNRPSVFIKIKNNRLKFLLDTVLEQGVHPTFQNAITISQTLMISLKLLFILEALIQFYS